MIYWRTTSSGAQLPPWLDGCQNLTVHGGAGTARVVGLKGKPWHQPPPEEAAWRDCGDGWQAIAWGPWSTAGLLRDQMRLEVVPALDGDNREWLAPLVLQPYPLDQLAFDVPLGADWKPEPTEEQRLLVNVAMWARDEIVKGLQKQWPDDHETLHQGLNIILPHDRTAMAVSDLLCACYHMNQGTLQACRLLDKRLMLGVLQAAAGMPTAALEKFNAAQA